MRAWLHGSLMIGSSMLGACGGGGEPPPAETGAPIGMSDEGAGGEERPAAVEGSIELALRRSDGSFLDVGELRGRRVLLVVMATFDGASQMLLRPLRQVAERHPDLVMVGIAAEPSARLLVGPYESSLEPPFPVTYDPEEAIPAGTSPLGPIEVPTLVMLDARGVERGRATGFQRAEAIEELIATAPD